MWKRRVLLEPGDCVAVEEPGYPQARRLFVSQGAQVVGVPVDGEGLVVEALPDDARVVYVTPSHQYLLGMAMSLRRRIALIAWARRRCAAIIEDDYDSEFRYAERPIEPLHALDHAGRVLYVGSFSKVLLPVLRIGFLVAPPSLQQAVRLAKQVTDWHTSRPTQAALARSLRMAYWPDTSAGCAPSTAYGTGSSRKLSPPTLPICWRSSRRRPGYT
jgi:GntR family transcriptional regulator / MocR family aminotransferase